MNEITTAIIAGAVAALKDTAEEAVKDAYHGLKAALSHWWFSAQPEAAPALDQLERNPDDPKAQQALVSAIQHRAAEEAPGEELKQRAGQMHRAIEQHGTPEDRKRYATIIQTLEAEHIRFAGGGKVAKGLDADAYIGHAKAKEVTFGNPPAKKA